MSDGRYLSEIFSKNAKCVKLVALLLLFVISVACGGGGGSSSDDEDVTDESSETDDQDSQDAIDDESDEETNTDDSAFAIVSSIPENSSTTNRLSKILVTFNSSIDSSSLNAVYFKVTRDGTTLSPVDLGFEGDSTTVVEVGLSNVEPAEGVYELTIDGALVDSDGDPLGEDVVISVTVSGVQPTLVSIQENIFSKSCAVSSCHTGSNPTGNMNLSSGNAEASLISVPSTAVSSINRVTPGEPDDSYLIKKLEGTATPRMPFNGTPLSQSEIDAVRDWITGLSE